MSYWPKQVANWARGQRIKLMHSGRALKTYTEKHVDGASDEEIGPLMQSKQSL